MSEPVWLSVVRRFLPGFVFRSLARLPRNPLAYVRRFGVGPGTLLYLRLIGFGGRLVEITIPGVRAEILLRAGTSDVTNFEQIFIRKEYHLSLGFEPRSIIDAGANIGLSAVFFANRYPDARILAVEPDRRNFEILVVNTRDYPNIKSIHSGLWSRCVPLRIVNPDDEFWAIRVEESGNGDGIAAITVEEALKVMDVERLDLLKLDIEGAERSVMGQSQGWIKDVRAIVAELHGPACEEAFFQAVGGHDFRRRHLGDDLILAWRDAASEAAGGPVVFN